MSRIDELASLTPTRGATNDPRIREILKFVQDTQRPSRLLPRDKRQAERYKFVVSAWAQQLDKNFGPIGTPFQVVTSNISKSGLCLYTQNIVETPYLSVRLENAPNEPMDLTLKIFRRRPVKGFIQIAGNFVSRGAVGS